MAEMEGGDEELRQDLLAFGEKVDKITDKNRAILVKKLNHLRARKRQSEKLSASMLESPKRGVGKGRGKKAATAKDVGATVIGTPEELVDKRLSVSLARNDAVVEPVASYSLYQPQALMVDSNVEDEAAPPVKKGRGGRTSTRVTKKTAADDQVSEADIGSNKVAGTRGRKKPGAGGDGKALNETLVVEVNEVNDERLVKCIDSSSVNVVNNNTVAVRRGRASVAAPRKAAETVEKPKGRKTIANDVTIPLEDNSALRDGGPSTSTSTVSEIATGRRGSYTVARSSPAAGEPGKTKAGIDDHGKTAEEAKAVSRIPTLARVPSKTLTPEVSPSPKLTVHVFDTTLGRPAVNVSLTLHYQGKIGSSWTAFGYHVTDSDGKYTDFAGSPMKCGTYRLHCDTGAYFHSTNTRCSYPYVDIVFNVTDTSRPTNLQLLLSPYSCTFTQTTA